MSGLTAAVKMIAVIHIRCQGAASNRAAGIVLAAITTSSLINVNPG